MDLEEARICEFNMHINSEYYNDPLSMLHNRKYLDDITYNYNPNKINVAVLTDDRDKYKVWSQWLKYLDNEVMYANTHYLMEKQKKVSSFRARRVDRKNSLNAYEKGCTQSFVSCSKGGYGTQFANKNQVILLEVEVSGESPYIENIYYQMRIYIYLFIH